MRSLFWKIFFVIWLTNLALLTTGNLLVRFDYEKEFEELQGTENLRFAAKYLVARYEAGMDTRDFRQVGPDHDSTRFSIKDLDTGVMVFGPRKTPDGMTLRATWDYVSPSNGRYRIYVSDQPRPLPPPPNPGLRILVAMIITALFSWLLTLLITRPLRQLQTHVQNLGEGDLSSELGRSVLDRRDEVGELAVAIDQMSERIRTLIDSKQRLFYDVSHELRAPLARLQVAAEIVRMRAENKGEETDVHQRLDREIESLNQLITELMSFARDDQAQYPRESINLVQLVEATVADQHALGDADRLKLSIEIEQDVELLTKPVLLDRALKNLLENALKYSDADLPVEVAVEKRADQFVIAVNDRGPGIAEAQMETVLQPFTRLHPESIEGVGLGLSIVLRAMTDIGGRLELKNRQGGGLEASLWLPV